jgi:hypothetical protein
MAEARTLAAGAQRRWEEEEGRVVWVGLWGLANGGPWTKEVSWRGTGGGLVGWLVRPGCIPYIECTQVHNKYTVYIYIYIYMW